MLERSSEEVSDKEAVEEECILVEDRFRKISLLIENHRVIKYFLHEDPHYLQAFEEECTMLRRLTHENIVAFLGTVQSPNLGIIMEYCERGALSSIVLIDVLDSKYGYSMRTILWWTEQLFRGLCYLHENRIVHTNITLDNILVAEDFSIRFCGFGCSIRDAELNNSILTPKSDVYSLGVVMWELVRRRKAFPQENEDSNQGHLLLKFSINEIEFLMNSIHFQKLQSIVESCTRSEAKERPEAYSVLLKIKHLRKKYLDWLVSVDDKELCELCTKNYVHKAPHRSTVPVVASQGQQTQNVPGKGDDYAETLNSHSVLQMEEFSIDNIDSARDTIVESMDKPLTEMVQTRTSKEVVFYLRHEPNNQLTKEIAFLPDKYQPDLKDEHFRDKEILDNGAFHSIGKGSQTTVIAAVLKSTGERVAAKRYRISDLEHQPNGFTNLLRKIQNTHYPSHPNIVKNEYFHQTNQKNELTYVWLITERMDCSFEFYCEHLEKHRATKKRDHRHVASFLVQIFRALDFLHSRGIMHRDVAPKNIGLNRAKFEIKLLDFGGSGQTNSRKDVTHIVATAPIFQPLEVLLVQNYDCGVDIWAAGLVAFQMLGNKLMFPRNDWHKGPEAVKQRILDVVGLPDDRYEKIFKDGLIDETPRPSTLDSEIGDTFENLEPDRNGLSRADLADLFKEILIVDRFKRLRAIECLEHPYLKMMNQKNNPQTFDANAIANKNEQDKEALNNMLANFSKNYSIDE